MSREVFTKRPLRARLPDWEIRLFTWLHRVRNEPLVWGKFDCVTGLAAGAVERQTGYDFTASLPHKFSTKTGAMRVLKKNWGDLPKMMDSFLVRANDRHRGNIILLNSDVGEGFGVRVGSDVVYMTPSGLEQSRVPSGSLEWTVVS